MSSTPAAPSLEANSASPPVAGWGLWLSWLAVCALFPVSLKIAWTAVNKPVLDSDPHAAAIQAALFAVIVVALIAPIYLQCLVLRRIVPGLGFWSWFWGLIGATGIWLGAHFIARESLDLARKVLGAKYAAEKLDFQHLLGLPWAQLLLVTGTLTGVMALLPAWILGRASGRASRAPLRWHLFLTAAIIGACAADVVETLYDLYFYRYEPLNGRSFLERINELSLIGGAGAVWGAASATWLCWFLERRGARSSSPAEGPRRPRVVQMLACVVLVALAAPLFRYSTGNQGLVSGFPTLRKALSLAPAEDRSRGTAILRFAHAADYSAPRPQRFPVVRFAPDGRSFVSRDAQGMLQQIELATGRRVRTLGEQLGVHENARFDWSPDGRYLVLRTDGPDWPHPNGRYVEHTNRLRVFATPTYAQVADFSFVEECFDFHGRALLVEGDSKSVWLNCPQSYSVPTPDNIMAVRMQLPDLKVMAVRRYGDLAARGRMQGFARTSLGTVAWLQDYRDRSTVHLYNLSLDQELTALRNLMDPAVMGELTQQSIDIDEEQIAVRACGNSKDVSNPAAVDREPAGVHSFCRTMRFDLQTGTLREQHDQANRDILALDSSIDALGSNLRITSTWQAASKSGELIVRTLTDDRELQRIATRGQRLLGVTRDGRWLVTHDMGADSLRIYTITR